MATMSISGFIYLASYGSRGLPVFEFFRSDEMAQCGYTMVTPHTITIELPEDFNPDAGIEAALERKRAAALDEAAKADRELAQLRQMAGKAE